MPYLLRSKGRRLVMRDRFNPTKEDPKGPVYPVTVDAWTPFEELPAGVSEQGDGDVLVREISEEKFKKAKKPQTIRAAKEERRAKGKLTPSEYATWEAIAKKKGAKAAHEEMHTKASTLRQKVAAKLKFKTDQVTESTG